MTQAQRDNYRLWAERFEIGAAAAQRLHPELLRKELVSKRESFLRCEVDKELAAALQPTVAGPYWYATKAAIQAGHSVGQIHAFQPQPFLSHPLWQTRW